MCHQSASMHLKLILCHICYLFYYITDRFYTRRNKVLQFLRWWQVANYVTHLQLVCFYMYRNVWLQIPVYSLLLLDTSQLGNDEDLSSLQKPVTPPKINETIFSIQPYYYYYYYYYKSLSCITKLLTETTIYKFYHYLQTCILKWNEV